MAALPALVAAGILGSEPEEGEGKPSGLQLCRPLPSRGLCDSCSFRVAGSAPLLSKGWKRRVCSGGRKKRLQGCDSSSHAWSQQPAAWRIPSWPVCVHFGSSNPRGAGISARITSSCACTPMETGSSLPLSPYPGYSSHRRLAIREDGFPVIFTHWSHLSPREDYGSRDDANSLEL